MWTNCLTLQKVETLKHWTTMSFVLFRIGTFCNAMKQISFTTIRDVCIIQYKVLIVNINQHGKSVTTNSHAACEPSTHLYTTEVYTLSAKKREALSRNSYIIHIHTDKPLSWELMRLIPFFFLSAVSFLSCIVQKTVRITLKIWRPQTRRKYMVRFATISLLLK